MALFYLGKFMRALFLASLVLGVTACGVELTTPFGSKKVGNDSSSENYKYNYEVNGCKTGEHEYSSKKDYCRALLDETLNNGCAYPERKATHDREC